jgi:hypothetical protein
MIGNAVIRLITGMPVLLVLSHAAWAQSATTDTSRGISVRYADGRITTKPLRPTGGMMTAIFPRIDGMETARDGLLLNGLQISHVVEGDEVVVTVSLLYRTDLNRATVKVATVRVAADRPIEVDELKQFGVEPITLSVVSIPTTYAFDPRGSSVSTYVDVRATPVDANAAAYRVTITNWAPVPLMWFRFEAYRSDGSPISARPRGKRNFPLIMPNSEYTFELASGTAGRLSGDDPGAWNALDRIEVTALTWQDGTVEGDKEIAAQHFGFERERWGHIRALLTILCGSGSIAALREAISGMRMRSPDVELEQVRTGFLKQLDRFARQQLSSEGLDFDTWRGRAIVELEQWLARIVFPKL